MSYYFQTALFNLWERKAVAVISILLSAIGIVTLRKTGKNSTTKSQNGLAK